jgi:carbon-monoxide dehydrogenase medium subunit
MSRSLKVEGLAMLMWKNYVCATSIDDALRFLAEGGLSARLIAGGTDLILELERGARPGVETLVDISRLPDLDRIWFDEGGIIHLGPLVTHNHVVASTLLSERALPLVQACWEVGAPQIRNRGTVAGNLITASPANDTIPPLMALGAEVVLRSLRGERVMPLASFYTGVRRTVMQPDEMLMEIRFPALSANQSGVFVKLGLRRAQAISLVNTAIVLTWDSDRIQHAVITLGSVAPMIVRALEAETFLQGKCLTEAEVVTAAELSAGVARPIDDLRSSAAYRQEMVRVAVSRGLRAIQGGKKPSLPANPPLLWGTAPDERPRPASAGSFSPHSAIHTRINGKEYLFEGADHKTLLRLLREDAGLIGTKEGCGEGECGACTVFLDGKAVMACLVPAPRAHAAEIVTIEGIAGDHLHPVQQAFIDAGAVQCGYCTPGFIMSGVKLLEENPQPNREQVRQAIAGNLCRCTGYYSIVAAIEQAAQSLSVS